jgi:hypothetical protein
VKTLYYDGRPIEFNDPADIEFNDEFHNRLYHLVFGAINDGDAYEPVIDVDELWNGQLGIDIVEIANTAGVTPKQTPTQRTANPERLAVQYHVLLFSESFPEMLGLFQNTVLNADTAIRNAEILLGADCDRTNFIQIKQIIDNLNLSAWTRQRDPSESQSGVATLGTISEKLLSRAFEAMVDNTNFFKVSSSQVQSYGDFVLMCLPNNLWLSVKSNFARERLLASGYSNDILGVGFFQDYEEFTSQVRIRNFQRAGFLAMYCPDVAVSRDQVENGTNTYDQIRDYYENREADMPLNINGQPFIRRLSDLDTDLQALLNIRNIQRRFTVSF